MTDLNAFTSTYKFTAESLQQLLRSETLRSRVHAESRYNLIPCRLPKETLYFVGSTVSDVKWSNDHAAGCVSSKFVLTELALVDLLLDENGLHPWWINLSPFAVTHDAAIFDVSYSRDFTDQVFVHPNAFPGEPFHLLGPSLPENWSEEHPLVPLALPFLEIQWER